MREVIWREDAAEETASTEEKNVMSGIARGRMHAALVSAIKFNSEGNDSEVAHTFCTTPGKVNDIRKDRNFKYVTKDLGFTAAEIGEAKERFAASVRAENSTVAEDARDAAIANANAVLDNITAIETSQLAGVRKAERKPRGKAADNETAVSTEEAADADESLDELLG